MNGTRMYVSASGNFTPGVDSVSPTVTIALYATKNPLATTPTITSIASATIAAAGLGIVASPWSIDAMLNADTASGVLQGRFTIQADNEAPSAWAAISAFTGVNMSADIPFALLVGVTFSQTGSGNTASMYEFTLEK